MKFSDDLYQLIQSLSQSEKRYVKLVSKAFTSKGTEKQVALFDAFEKQKEYDEQKIRDQFEGVISAKNFHVAKNRLYNLVLKALYLFHANTSEEERTKQMLFQAKILTKKGLHKQSDALTDKVLKSARATEGYLTLLGGLTHHANSIAAQRDIVKRQQFVERNLEEEYRTIEAYKESITYFYLQEKILKLTHKQKTARSEEDLEELHKLKEHPLLQDGYEIISERSRMFYHMLNGFLARYEGNYERAVQYWQYFLEKFEQTSNPTKLQVEDHIKDLNNMMFLQLEGEQHTAAWDTCQRLVQLLEWDYIKTQPNLQRGIIARVVEFKLEYFLYSYQYQKGLDYINEHKDGIEEVCAQSDEFRNLVITHNMSAIYLSNEAYELANETILQTLSSKILKKHPYIHAEAMLFNILVHFELGHNQLLDSLLLNTYRMLSKRKLLYQTEKIIFKHIRKYLNTKKETDILQSFHAIKRELQEAKLDRFEKNALPTFDLIVWIESKIQNKSMIEVVTQSGLSV